MRALQLEEFKRRKAAAQAAKKQQQSTGDAPLAAPAEASLPAEQQPQAAAPPSATFPKTETEPPAPLPAAAEQPGPAAASQTAAAPSFHGEEPVTVHDAPDDDATEWGHPAETVPPAWGPPESADEHDWQTLDREDALPAAADSGWQGQGSVGSVNGPGAAAAAHHAESHPTGGSDAAASNGGASFTAESPDVGPHEPASDPAASQSELEQWQTYATQLEEQVAAAQADVGAWADAHQELSMRLAQTEEALTVLSPALTLCLEAHHCAILGNRSPAISCCAPPL